MQPTAMVIVPANPKLLKDIRIDKSHIFDWTDSWPPSMRPKAPKRIPFNRHAVPLVKALNLFGVLTLYSCHGHWDYNPVKFGLSIGPDGTREIWGRREPFPEIKMETDIRSLDWLAQFIARFNESSETKWELVQDAPLVSLKPTDAAKTVEGLRELRRSSKRLARFLFAEFMKQNARH